MVLITAILLLLILGALATISVQWASQDLKRTNRFVKASESFYLADAGIQHAINHMNYDANGYSPGAAADLSEALTSWPDFFNKVELEPNYTYAVQLSDNIDGDSNPNGDSDNVVTVLSTGNYKDTETTIEAQLYRPLYKAGSAILVEGPFEADGNASITGSLGNIHSNTSVTVDGNISATEGATTSPEGSCEGNRAVTCYDGKFVHIPEIDPAELKAYANYVLQADGAIHWAGPDGVLDSGGDDALFKKNTWGYWTENGDDSANIFITLYGLTHTEDEGWTTKKNWGPGVHLPNNAFIYVEGDFKSSTNMGEADNPWEVTLVAEKNVQFNKNAYLKNCNSNCVADSTIGNLFLVAGNDVMADKLKEDSAGIIIAKDQLNIGGNITFKGYLVANDKSDSSSVVTVNSIGGGIVLDYDGDITGPFLSDKVEILSWREL
jgi:hypothetical protein